jgi:large subunit ribosomal protein L25
MEKALLLEARIREQTGSKSAEKLRREGRIPAVVYGHKKETVAISLDGRSLMEALHRSSRVLDIKVDNKPEKMIVKDIQYDYLCKDVIHLDLMRVDVSETIKIMVPIELKGPAKGTTEGGVITAHINRLEVECKVTDIPEVVVVSIKEMGIGDTIHAGDIKLPEGVKLVSNPALLIVTCSIIAEVKTTEEVEAETPVTPEVITEKKLEEGEGEEAAEEKK